MRFDIEFIRVYFRSFARRFATREFRPSAPTSISALTSTHPSSPAFRKLRLHSPPTLRSTDSSAVSSKNHVPFAIARLTSIESSMLRFMATSGDLCRSNGDNAILNMLPEAPAIITPFTTSELEAMSPETPSKSKTSQHFGLIQSPQIFSLGNFPLSQSNTRAPSRARRAAQEEPAGPAPTMTTSK